jgi:hypothetical protein
MHDSLDSWLGAINVKMNSFALPISPVYINVYSWQIHLEYPVFPM